MGVFDRMIESGHEQVIFCHDRVTGMKAIIAVHDTALGPARGGTRYKAYASEEEALVDALRLARGMTYKFAFTDMPRGGGKAVILKEDGGADKHLLLRVFGRFVQLLAGRFGTGPDLGTSAADMAEIARETDYVWAIDERFGGTGASTPLTARGVLVGIGAALNEVEGTPDLSGRRVAVQGLGGVGGELARLLAAAGAKVVGADLDPARAKDVAGELGIDLSEPDALYDADCDVFSPNAVGGVLNGHTIPRLRCRIVAGGANAQLATPQDGRRLMEHGILYAPDYVINSAAPYAVIGAGELGYSSERLDAAVEGVAAALELIFRRARAEGRPTAEVADRIAEERIAAAAQLRALAPGTGAAPRAHQP
ncbi:MAG TPA: Glu/Leu/Phe/Val dehydrogenase dimerization domain-containing protein [Actinomycetes bacterium]|nr:Glu/Leu/Phe/Val dehydrogenase dimerization domain-containing protein [Actinomycetes bacterium]